MAGPEVVNNPRPTVPPGPTTIPDPSTTQAEVSELEGQRFSPLPNPTPSAAPNAERPNSDPPSSDLRRQAVESLRSGTGYDANLKPQVRTDLPTELKGTLQELLTAVEFKEQKLNTPGMSKQFTFSVPAGDHTPTFGTSRFVYNREQQLLRQKYESIILTKGLLSTDTAETHVEVRRENGRDVYTVQFRDSFVGGFRVKTDQGSFLVLTHGGVEHAPQEQVAAPQAAPRPSTAPLPPGVPRTPRLPTAEDPITPRIPEGPSLNTPRLPTGDSSQPPRPTTPRLPTLESTQSSYDPLRRDYLYAAITPEVIPLLPKLSSSIPDLSTTGSSLTPKERLELEQAQQKKRRELFAFSKKDNTNIA